MELRAVAQGRHARPILIVNADDFGLTPGVCRGVLRAHDRGIVTSTSALVVAPAFDRYAAALRDSGLAVGIHLAVAGEDPPMLGATEVPSLVDRRGRFPQRWQDFVAAAARRSIDSDDLRREFGAQIERLRSTGVRITHVDTHMNLHLWPQLAAVVVEVAQEHGIGAIRVPRAGGWRPVGCVVRGLSARLAQRAAAAGLRFPGTSSGLDEAGVDRHRMEAMVGRLAASGVSSAELVVHLGERPDPDLARYRTRFRWDEELAAVCDPSSAGVLDRHGFRLGSFADLTVTAVPAAPQPGLAAGG